MPTALQQQRETMQRLAEPGALSVPVSSPAPEDPAEPEPSTWTKPTERRAEPTLTLEEMLERWMKRQRSERVTIIRPGLTVTISVLFLYEDDMRVYFAFDPKVVAFDKGAVSTIVVELEFEDRLELGFKDQRCSVVFAGGMFLLPGVPFAIISFFKVK